MLMTGVPQTMNRLRQEFGIKIGSSTGYTSEIMEKLRVGLNIHKARRVLLPRRTTKKRETVSGTERIWNLLKKLILS